MIRFADKITGLLAQRNQDVMDRYDIYRYGIVVGLEIITFFISCLTAAILLDRVVECLFCLTIFGLLRSYIGGLHCSKFLSCYIVSTFIIVAIILTSGWYTPFKLVTAGINILLLGTLLFVLQKRKRSGAQEEYFYIKGRNLAVIVLFVAVLLFLLNQNTLSFVLSLTLMVIVVSYLLKKEK